MLTLSLVSRSLRRERARTFSAVLGVGAAVGLLAWHLGLAYTAISQGGETARKASAPFTAWITGPAQRGGGMMFGPQDDKPKTPLKGRNRAKADETVGFRRRMTLAGPLPEELLLQVESSTLAEKTCPLSVHAASLDMRPGGRVLQGPPMMASIAALPEGGLPFAAKLSEGRLPEPGKFEAVASQTLFDMRVPKPALGSPIPMILRQGTLTLTVVGFFPASDKVKAFPTLYTTDAAMEEMAALDPTMSLDPNLLLVETKPGADPADLGLLMDEIPEADSCSLSTCEAVAKQFRNDTVNNLVKSLPLSLSLALITAACMLGTVLTIGLALRRRRIAELRCAGMTRAGVCRLELVETLCLLVPGWLLGLGVACAALQVFLYSIRSTGEFPLCIHIGWQTPFFTGILALIVGIAASVVPCVKAMRVKPLEVVGTDVSEARPVSFAKTVLGVLLLVPMPLLALAFPFTAMIRMTLMAVVGIPCWIAGSLLCVHPLMRLTEALFVRPLGWVLRLDPRILSRRLSRDPGRAFGTILTLALGLGGFMAIHIWGGTLMSAYVPSSEWPDVIVSALPNGLTAAQTQAVNEVEGVAKPVLPIECSQFPFDTETADAIRAKGGTADGAVLIFGADPKQAFGGENPLAHFKFLAGNREDAARQMAEGSACVIPVMLSRLTGLKLGDKMSLAGHAFTIAGIIDLNWHLVTSRAQVRNLFGRLDRGRSGMGGPGSMGGMSGGHGGGAAGGMGGGPDGMAGRPNGPSGAGNRPKGAVMPMGRMPTLGVAFVSEKMARELTGNTEHINFLWLNLSKDYRAIHPLQAAIRLDAGIRKAVKDDGASAIQVHHRDEITDGTISHGNQILGTMAQIPFWSLIVTSTGIIALLIASAQSSKKEIAMMRAIGMTRGQLARMFFGEALLVSFCALVLSFIGGGLIGWSFTGWTATSMRAGMAVTLSIPWKLIGGGAAFALSLCLVMSVLPLAWITRREE